MVSCLLNSSRIGIQPYLAKTLSYYFNKLENIHISFKIFEYRGTKKATVLVWRPEEGIHEDNTPFLRVTQVVNAEPFRNEDGSLVPDGNLTLSLSDFVPSCMTSSITSPLPAFSISYLKLAGFLQLGEAHQQVSESKAGIGRKALPPGMRVLKRSVSPEETLSPETERRFVESEEEIKERSMRDDELYRQGR
ncbi:MAG: hypothetical protein M1840_003620 [Geoglossum simile]|nr:MAG: hypothetical protein M1840_003620 [Geoglossum simile]